MPDVHWQLDGTKHADSGISLTVNPSDRRQKILGFGGAFTEASAINWLSLEPSAREEVLHLYFDAPEKGGNGYVLGRVHINSCDFSPKPYTFDDTEDDADLKHFDSDVSHDAKSMLPFIKAASERISQSYSSLRYSPKLQIIGSPWSPPAWMKVSHSEKRETSMFWSAKPMGLNPKYSRTWAEYISKFVSAYRRHGVQVWAITAQNEPGFTGPWESCVFSPRNESIWIRNHLGPVLRRDHPDLKILAFDHNKDKVVKWAEEMYKADDGATAKFVDGLAVHWYGGSWFENLQRTREIGGPNKLIVSTEASNCNGVAWGGQKLEERWARAEALAYDILGDLSAGASAWLDWNLLLDPSGGPTHVPTTSCDASVIADAQRKLGQDKTVVIQPSYYYIGHISRFVPPNSTLIGLTVGKDITIPKSLTTTNKVLLQKFNILENQDRTKDADQLFFTQAAFESPHADSQGRKRITVIVLNRGDQVVKHRLAHADYGVQTPDLYVPARSVTTYVYWYGGTGKDDAVRQVIRFFHVSAKAYSDKIAFQSWPVACITFAMCAGVFSWMLRSRSAPGSVHYSTLNREAPLVTDAETGVLDGTSPS